MTLQTLIKQVGVKLHEQLGNVVFHYYRPKDQQFPFCVWAEDSETNSFVTQDGREQNIHFTVDYYTQTEYDPNLDIIQATLDTLTKSWRLSAVMFDTEVNAIHYEWEMELAWQSFRQ